MTTPEYREGKLQEQVNELTVQLEASRKEVVRLREALEDWMRIIDYQYSGSREAMSFLQNRSNDTEEALSSTIITPEWEHNWHREWMMTLKPSARCSGIPYAYFLPELKEVKE